VFAECLIRLPAEEQTRFVDYSRVECEQAVDLADETDTLNSPGEGTRRVGAPTDLTREHLHIMSLLESQIEGLQQQFQDELTTSQVEAQKTFQHF